MSDSIPSKELIMNDQGCKAMIHRIAYEIYESNYSEKRLVVVGIGSRGGKIAKALIQRLEEISPLKIHYIPAEKTDNPEGIRLVEDNPEVTLAKTSVLIVDDVLYSGRTMFRTIAELDKYEPSRIQNAVLIDRGHRFIPVRPDFVGIELATTLKQHVSVEISSKNKIQAFLI